MKNFKNFFKKKIEEPKEEFKYTLEEILNIDFFNIWFKTLYEGYGGRPGGAAGIFGRTDKLSESMVQDYFDYYKIDVEFKTIIKFYREIRDEWMKKY